jgi:hypothetical protein
MASGAPAVLRRSRRRNDLHRKLWRGDSPLVGGARLRIATLAQIVGLGLGVDQHAEELGGLLLETDLEGRLNLVHARQR